MYIVILLGIKRMNCFLKKTKKLTSNSFADKKKQKQNWYGPKDMAAFVIVFVNKGVILFLDYHMFVCVDKDMFNFRNVFVFILVRIIFVRHVSW